MGRDGLLTKYGASSWDDTNVLELDRQCPKCHGIEHFKVVHSILGRFCLN